ncbi:MAG: YHS domain-containing protein [Pseudomonadota bacterium]|nr:YHS domain-containing protein [Pseudomonadota bacterium]
MVTAEDEIVDPVCGMPVAVDLNAVDYLGMHFAFCSLQCKERFLANPHLYIGQPGQTSFKQEGGNVLKRRGFRLTTPLTKAMSAQLTDEIQSMMGIKDIDINGDTIEITYDLVEATALQIESRLEAVGAVLGRDRGQGLRRAFVHFSEETEVDSLENAPSSHGQHHH